MQPKKELSLFDSTCLIVGIIIGAGIYEVSPSVATAVGNWWPLMLIWIGGGLLSLFGALGYAELATAYPQEGGDYVYQTRAYGKWAGFLFGWVQLSVVRPGDIVAMTFIFARYAKQLYNPWSDSQMGHWIYGGSAVVFLTIINVLGVKEGKWTQNLLTVIKSLGLLAIFVVALTGPAGQEQAQAEPLGEFPISVALVMVLFTFGGWNEMAYVAAEVKNPNRNIVRALVLGTTSVTVLYLLANGAFVYALGYAGVAHSQAVAADTISQTFPNYGGRMISALICVSALGAVNGLIFTGARISYAVGADHRAFGPLGKWSSKTGTPVRALILQGAIALALVFLLGSFLQTILFTSGAVYTFYLATNLAVIVLRFKDRQVPRPYKVTGFPVTTIIFCITCAYLIYSTVTYCYSQYGQAYGSIIGLLLSALPFIILLVGLPLYLLTTPKKSALENPSSND